MNHTKILMLKEEPQPKIVVKKRKNMKEDSMLDVKLNDTISFKVLFIYKCKRYLFIFQKNILIVISL
jgi:hypothetical protein